MAEEVVLERDFPCPCGMGVLLVEVLEHDTWASGRHSRWSLQCVECAGRYREPFLSNVLVAREHYDELERWERRIYERRRAVGEMAYQRYIVKFKDHVQSLRFRTAMKDALGLRESIAYFRKRTRVDGAFDKAIEDALRQNPAHALRQLNVDDAEIAAELAAIEAEEASRKALFELIPKHPIPQIEV